MLYIYLPVNCITTVIYMSQKGLMQAGGVFRCPSGLSCFKGTCTVVCISEIQHAILSDYING